MATDKVNLPPGFELDQVQKNLPQGFQLDNNVNIKKIEPIKQEPSLGSKLSTIAKSIPSNIAQGLAEGGISRAITKSAGLEVTPKQLIESEALPIAGGIAGATLGATAGYLGTGGLASGALATGGAALGGAAGEAFRQLGARGLRKLGQDVNVPETATEAAKKIGREGLVQGLSEAVGAGIITPAAKFAGKLIPKSAEIANRFFGSTPSDIAVSRLRDKELPLGEEVLTNPKLKEFIINDKKQIYEKAVSKIEDLSGKVKNEIKSILKGGEGDVGMSPFTRTGYNPSISTREIADSVDPLIKEASDTFGANSNEVRKLQRFKNNFMSGKPEQLNFALANNIRESIGESIGKRFEKMTGELPEITQAQKNIFVALRKKIGEISPTIDNLLKEQHTLYDIKRTVEKPASKGYEEIGKTAREQLGLTMKKMSKANKLKKFEEFAPEVLPPIRRATTSSTAEVLDQIFGDNK